MYIVYYAKRMIYISVGSSMYIVDAKKKKKKKKKKTGVLLHRKMNSTSGLKSAKHQRLNGGTLSVRVSTLRLEEVIEIQR